jgi:hypothetical protein
MPPFFLTLKEGEVLQSPSRRRRKRKRQQLHSPIAAAKKETNL